MKTIAREIRENDAEANALSQHGRIRFIGQLSASSSPCHASILSCTISEQYVTILDVFNVFRAKVYSLFALLGIIQKEWCYRMNGSVEFVGITKTTICELRYKNAEAMELRIDALSVTVPPALVGS